MYGCSLVCFLLFNLTAGGGAVTAAARTGLGRVRQHQAHADRVTPSRCAARRCVESPGSLVVDSALFYDGRNITFVALTRVLGAWAAVFLQPNATTGAGGGFPGDTVFNMTAWWSIRLDEGDAPRKLDVTCVWGGGEGTRERCACRS